jgi:hypothetical protein
MITIFAADTLEEHPATKGLHAFKKHTASVNGLQWSPDSSHLARDSLRRPDSFVPTLTPLCSPL